MRDKIYMTYYYEDITIRPTEIPNTEVVAKEGIVLDWDRKYPRFVPYSLITLGKESVILFSGVEEPGLGLNNFHSWITSMQERYPRIRFDTTGYTALQKRIRRA